MTEQEHRDAGLCDMCGLPTTVPHIRSDDPDWWAPCDLCQISITCIYEGLPADHEWQWLCWECGHYD